jgi:hypothetical protein
MVLLLVFERDGKLKERGKKERGGGALSNFDDVLSHLED